VNGASPAWITSHGMRSALWWVEGRSGTSYLRTGRPTRELLAAPEHVTSPQRWVSIVCSSADDDMDKRRAAVLGNVRACEKTEGAMVMSLVSSPIGPQTHQALAACPPVVASARLGVIPGWNESYCSLPQTVARPILI
jgi:hypothetical protein